MPRKTRKNTQPKRNQPRPAFIGLIIAATLSVVAICIASWLVYDSRQTENEKTEDIACTLNDEELCKFFTVNGAQSAYKAVVTTTSSKGVRTTVNYENDGENRARYRIKEGKTTHEYIIIDKIIYMKAADGTWWKQILSTEKLKEYSRGYDFRFRTPSPAIPDSDRVTFTMYSTEWYVYPYQLKYQVNDPASPGETSFIWFDTEDYLLKRYLRQGSDGTMDVTFTFGDVIISEPSEVKILGPNQYILPGGTKPETISSKQ